MAHKKRCPECNGRGEIDNKECQTCNGTGWFRKKKEKRDGEAEQV